MAFTDYETEQLRKALLKETRRCAVTRSMTLCLSAALLWLLRRYGD